VRVFIVSSTPQATTGKLLVHATPLFKEEGSTGPSARALDFFHPINSHWPSTWPGFTAHNGPVYIRQVKIADRLYKRLERDESSHLRNAHQITYAMLDGASFNGCPDPNLPEWAKNTVLKKLSHAIWSLGKNLEVMLGNISHDAPD
jgi:hypothetical protein